ncbi:MAG: Crp/Fnr family transcriptional regulator [Bacillota bacterium]|jgi:CRP/FNR family transcriptional regulator
MGLPQSRLRSPWDRNGSGSQESGRPTVAALGKYVHLAERVRYREGQILFTQGQRGQRGLYWLRSGRVKFSLLTDDGLERVVGFAGEGDVFGETSVLRDAGHVVMAEAVSDCVVYVFEPAVVLRVLHEDPDLAVELLEVLARKLEFSVKLVEEMTFLGVKERLARTIVRLAADSGPRPADRSRPVSLQVTHQELANMIGASRVMVTQALAELAREGAIEHGRCRVVVRDLDRLLDHGCPRGTSESRPDAKRAELLLEQP